MNTLILFEPELASNVGSIIRTCVCFNVKLYIIRPTSFVWDEKKIKHTSLDYIDKIEIRFFNSFQEVVKFHDGRIIATNCSNTAVSYKKFTFLENDAILMGKESTGLPEEISSTLNNITIPIEDRSLNLAIASAILVSYLK